MISFCSMFCHSYLGLLCCIILVSAVEVCQTESFTASCPDNQVIVMKSANYGRMRLGRCVQVNITMQSQIWYNRCLSLRRILTSWHEIFPFIPRPKSPTYQHRGPMGSWQENLLFSAQLSASKHMNVFITNN